MYCIIKVLHLSDGAVMETGVSHRANVHPNAQSPQDTHILAEILLIIHPFPTVHCPCPGYVKQYTSQPSVHCPYRLYDQWCSHFSVYKNKTIKLKKNLVF